MCHLQREILLPIDRNRYLSMDAEANHLINQLNQHLHIQIEKILSLSARK